MTAYFIYPMQQITLIKKIGSRVSTQICLSKIGINNYNYAHILDGANLILPLKKVTARPLKNGQARLRERFFKYYKRYIAFLEKKSYTKFGFTSGNILKILRLFFFY